MKIKENSERKHRSTKKAECQARIARDKEKARVWAENCRLRRVQLVVAREVTSTNSAVAREVTTTK